MRKWWIFSIKEIDVFKFVTEESPSCFFEEQTSNIKKMEEGLCSDLLSTIATTCDSFLMPLVLCPWGCSEYLHKVGYISFDIIIQRYVPSCAIELICNVEKCNFTFSARDDFLRENVDEYENLLLNPLWKVVPSIAFIPDMGPHVLTCSRHNGGVKKSFYIFHVIPFFTICHLSLEINYVML